MCHEVPLLLALDSASLKCLSATSAWFRHLVHNFVSSVTVGIDHSCGTMYDMTLLSKCQFCNLQSLDLRIPMGYNMVFCLTIADFPGLRKLKVAIMGIDNFPFKLLAKGNWPDLLSLDLSNTHISADAKEDLKHGNWPLLEEVTMRYCGLDAKSIAHLVEANWPCLKCLQLEGNFMEALAFWCLGKGAWPLLEVLHAGDGLTCAACACMMRGNWPHMQSVSVGSGSMSVASCRILNIPNCWSDLRKCHMGV